MAASCKSGSSYADADPRCEQMGVGKTLMCLSLIVSTLSSQTLPPPESIDISPILTIHSLATYPFEPHVRARQALGMQENINRIPSLTEMCAGIASSSDALRQEVPPPPSVSHILDAPRFYLDYHVDEELSRQTTARGQGDRRVPRKVYLANTTLIVVPQILIEQWMQEIQKHVVEGTLKILRIDRKALPSIEELIKYDVSLMIMACGTS